MTNGLLKGAAAAGAVLLGAGAIFYWREKNVEQPDYQTLANDGPLEIRKYAPMVVAEARVSGPRKDALNRGFQLLADYIFAKSRGGEALPMTAPVLQDSGEPLPMTAPVLQDGAEGTWRVRFVMPADRTRDTLPPPPNGVELVEVAARKLGAARFAGVADDERLSAEEDRLRAWLAGLGERASGEPEYAFYNSPFIPPPLRRSEVLIPLA